MKNKTKAILIILAILVLLVLIALISNFILFKMSDEYNIMCAESSTYDETGHVIGLDIHLSDLSWYEDVRTMSNKDFYYWCYDNVLSSYTELTPEQYIIYEFSSPYISKFEYSECETELDLYKLSLKYSTEDDLKAYNEVNSTNFNSIEELVYADYGNQRSKYLYVVITNLDVVQSFATEHNIKGTLLSNLWHCEREILADYYGYEVTDEEINDSISLLIDEGKYTWYEKPMIKYFYNHEWKSIAASDALLNVKVGARLGQDFPDHHSSSQ